MFHFQANFGDILIPVGSTPAPVSLGTLGFNPRVHDVFAGDVIVLNSRQIKLVNLDYDGNGPGKKICTFICQMFTNINNLHLDCS